MFTFPLCPLRVTIDVTIIDFNMKNSRVSELKIIIKGRWKGYAMLYFFSFKCLKQKENFLLCRMMAAFYFICNEIPHRHFCPFLLYKTSRLFLLKNVITIFYFRLIKSNF